MAFVDDINWVTGRILIGRATMPVIQVTPEIRALDTDTLWEELKDLEAGQAVLSDQGMLYPNIQLNNPAYTISGIQFAQGYLIIPPYFIEFEDGQYSVLLRNTNNNIVDVTVENQVRLIINLTAGLITGRLTDADVAQLFQYVLENGETFEDQLRLIRAGAAGDIRQAGDGTYVIRDAADTKDRIDGARGPNGGREIASTDGT